MYDELTVVGICAMQNSSKDDIFAIGERFGYTVRWVFTSAYIVGLVTAKAQMAGCLLIM